MYVRLAFVFDDWPTKFSPPPRLVVEPPVEVIVELGVAIARTHKAGRGGVAMRVRAEGLCLDETCGGMLHAWARSTRGDWLALVEFRIRTGNNGGFLDVRQWCPSGSITPKQPPPE